MDPVFSLSLPGTIWKTNPSSAFREIGYIYLVDASIYNLNLQEVEIAETDGAGNIKYQEDGSADRKNFHNLDLGTKTTGKSYSITPTIFLQGYPFDDWALYGGLGFGLEYITAQGEIYLTKENGNTNCNTSSLQGDSVGIKNNCRLIPFSEESINISTSAVFGIMHEYVKLMGSAVTGITGDVQGSSVSWDILYAISF